MFPWYLQFSWWESPVFPILLFCSISLHCSFKAFLSLLAILWNSAFSWIYLSFSPLPFTSLLYLSICKASLATLPSCIPLSFRWFWSTPPIQCYGPLFFPTFLNLSMNLATRSSWSESQSAPSLVFADCIELLSIFGCKDHNQSDLFTGHVVMSICRVVSCVVGKGCSLYIISVFS